MTDLRYIESSTGVTHLVAPGAKRSLCGAVESHTPRGVTNNWRAAQIISGDTDRGSPDLNPDLCERCWNAARKRHSREYTSLLEMTDEHLAGF